MNAESVETNCKLGRPCPKECPTPAHFDELEIPKSDIQIVKKQEHRLGEGNFGEVWRGTYKGHMLVAIKMLKLRDELGQNNELGQNTDSFLAEARTMHALAHPKIVKILGVCTQSSPMMIVTEFVENGTLSNYLRNSFKGGYSQSLNFDVLLKMINQACTSSGS